MDGYSSQDLGRLATNYRFLHRLFLDPEERFWQFLVARRDSLRRELGIVLDESLTSDRLREEYTRLFCGPVGHLPPCESAFVEGRFWGASAVWVRQFLRRARLEVVADFTMPPDHIAVEMEVLERLLAAPSKEARALYREFFLSRTPWMEDYLRRLAGITTLTFYETSFEFGRAFLAAERERLKSIVVAEAPVSA